MAIDLAARRYASALLDVAADRGIADRCLADLKAFQATVVANPELAAAIQSPSITRDALAHSAWSLAGRMVLDEIVRGFLAVLGQHRRLASLPAVIAAFADEVDRRAGRARGELVSSGPVSPSQVMRIRDAVGKAIGRSLVLSQKTDPSLLGGLRVTVGDRVFDLSTKSYLESLRSRLLAGR